MARPLVPMSYGNWCGRYSATKPRRFRHPGRKPIGDREALTGILFVFRKLRFVTEKDEETKFAFFNLGMAIIAFRVLYPNAFC